MVGEDGVHLDREGVAVRAQLLGHVVLTIRTQRKRNAHGRLGFSVSFRI